MSMSERGGNEGVGRKKVLWRLEMEDLRIDEDTAFKRVHVCLCILMVTRRD